MGDYYFTYSRQEMQSLACGVRTCIDFLTGQDTTPFSLFLPEEQYFMNVSTYKSDIIRFLPVDYLGFRHKHRDAYVHFADKSHIQKILQDGYLDRNCANENGSVGKAIYTYPLHSGLLFSNDNPDGQFLLFESDEEHCHICQTSDTPMGIGEADFFCDRLRLINPKIMNRQELILLNKKTFDWKTAQHGYFGIDIPEIADIATMRAVLEHYNYDWHPMPPV